MIKHTTVYFKFRTGNIFNKTTQVFFKKYFMILLGSWVYLLSTYSKFNPKSSSTLNYTIRNFRWYFLHFHWLVSMILSEEINEKWKQ